MEEYLKRLEGATDLRQVIELIDRIIEGVRNGQSSRDERRQFVRLILLNETLLQTLDSRAALDHLMAGITPEAWTQQFGDAVERELPKIIVDLVDLRADLDHRQALRFLPDGNPKVIFSILKSLNAYLDKQKDSARRMRGMRAARIMSDLYRMMQIDDKAWRRRSPPACCIDGERIGKLKEVKQFDLLAEAY